MSNGQGQFPLVPFYTVCYPDHGSLSTKVMDTFRMESTMQELLDDHSFSFTWDECDPRNRVRGKSCPRSCKDFVPEYDFIDMSLYQEYHIRQLLTCLMVLQQGDPLPAERFFNPDHLFKKPSLGFVSSRAGVHSRSELPR